MANNEAYQFPFTYPVHARFVVRNIIKDSNKTIRIFDYPIPVGTTRDLLLCENICEADIRASLLKGVLRNKIIAGEIEIVDSDMDLLQFDDQQKAFLRKAGVVKGLEVDGNSITALAFLWREEISLIGTRDGLNKAFYTPDKFLNGTFTTGDHFHIHVKHNGRDLYESVDYSIGESSGPGTGYDTINLISLVPVVGSQLFATYAVKAP